MAGSGRRKKVGEGNAGGVLGSTDGRAKRPPEVSSTTRKKKMVKEHPVQMD